MIRSAEEEQSILSAETLRFEDRGGRFLLRPLMPDTSDLPAFRELFETNEICKQTGIETGNKQLEDIGNFYLHHVFHEADLSSPEKFRADFCRGRSRFWVIIDEDAKIPPVDIEGDQSASTTNHFQYPSGTGGRIIGSIALEDKSEHEGELRRMAVSSEYRRRGLARRLNEHLIAYARAQGFTTIFLTTPDFNTPALHMYESVGYVVEWSGRGYDVPNCGELLITKMRLQL